jgi:hypothetical protein
MIPLRWEGLSELQNATTESLSRRAISTLESMDCRNHRFPLTCTYTRIKS